MEAFGGSAADILPEDEESTCALRRDADTVVMKAK
jgi:hypothetical protein